MAQSKAKDTAIEDEETADKNEAACGISGETKDAETGFSGTEQLCQAIKDDLPNHVQSIRNGMFVAAEKGNVSALKIVLSLAEKAPGTEKGHAKPMSLAARFAAEAEWSEFTAETGFEGASRRLSGAA